MKRLFILFAAAVMVMGLYSCGKGTNGKDCEKAITVQFYEKDNSVRYTMHNNTDEVINNVKVRFLYEHRGEQFHYEDEFVNCRLEPGLTATFRSPRSAMAARDEEVKVIVVDYNIESPSNN